MEKFRDFLDRGLADDFVFLLLRAGVLCIELKPVLDHDPEFFRVYWNEYKEVTQ